MKIVLVVALLAIAASSASAQFYAYSQGYGQFPLQQQILLQQQVLNPCSQFVRQQCGIVTNPFLQSPTFQLRNCQVVQQQCCQQLKLMVQQSHCQAISSVQAIAQQLQLQQFGSVYFDQAKAQAQAFLALNLPSMCGIYPSYYSNIVTVGGVWY